MANTTPTPTTKRYSGVSAGTLKEILISWELYKNSVTIIIHPLVNIATIQPIIHSLIWIVFLHGPFIMWHPTCICLMKSIPSSLTWHFSCSELKQFGETCFLWLQEVGWLDITVAPATFLILLWLLEALCLDRFPILITHRIVAGSLNMSKQWFHEKIRLWLMGVFSEGTGQQSIQVYKQELK